MGETNLGSVFDALDEGEGPRGEDLVHTIEVPRSALGHPGGQLVPVPEKIVHAGERVARVIELDPEPGWVHLQLGEDFPEGAALKLRGRGQPRSEGRAGDLILRVQFNDDATVRLPPGPSLMARPEQSPARAADLRRFGLAVFVVAAIGALIAVALS